jgi:type I restriction enzyme M protein
MFASLNEGGKMALVIDTGAASRGSGNQGSNKERDVRKTFVEDDVIEAVFLMPENMFYNTTAPGIIIVLNRNKKHKGEILLVNGSPQFSKGKPKNYLEVGHIQAMADAYLKWKAIDGLSAIITKDEATKNDYNLSPSRYVSTGAEEEVLPLDEAVILFRQAEEERNLVDKELNKILATLGVSE